jgi:hypothetical protein
VVFLAGAKLLDSVRAAPAAVQAGPYPALTKRRTPIGRSRPTLRRFRPSSESRISRRRD